MSRPAGRGCVARQQGTPPRLCVLRYRANQVPSPAQNSNIAAQYSTRQPNHPLHAPPTLQKCSTRRVNVTHPSSVLRFLRFSGRHKPHQPDIAAHTASGRDEVARVRHGQSRRSDAGPSWGLGGAGLPQGRGRAATGPGPGQMGWGLEALGVEKREIQGILIKITLTQTVICTPQLPLMKQGKTQVSKK